MSRIRSFKSSRWRGAWNWRGAAAPGAAGGHKKKPKKKKAAPSAEDLAQAAADVEASIEAMSERGLTPQQISLLTGIPPERLYRRYKAAMMRGGARRTPEVVVGDAGCAFLQRETVGRRAAMEPQGLGDLEVGDRRGALAKIVVNADLERKVQGERGRKPFGERRQRVVRALAAPGALIYRSGHFNGGNNTSCNRRSRPVLAAIKRLPLCRQRPAPFAIQCRARR
jgi:hypothetical protein